MEPIVVLPAKQLQNIIDKYVAATNRLIEAEKELAVLKDDQYVNWNWIYQYFDVTRPTAMLAEEEIFVYGRQVKRFRKSVILKFAERNSIKAKNVSQAE